MTLAEFRRQIAEAIACRFPQAKSDFTAQRGIKIRGRVEIDASALIDVYFNAATGKTTYALVKMGKRILGYDNFRGWHRHPAENPDQHVACQEPAPDQVLREMKPPRAHIAHTLSLSSSTT
jgi:hypothetical protein